MDPLVPLPLGKAPPVQSNVAKFAEDMGGELMLQTFTAVQKSNNIDNLVRLNKIIGKLVVEIVNGARSISK